MTNRWTILTAQSCTFIFRFLICCGLFWRSINMGSFTRLENIFMFSTLSATRLDLIRGSHPRMRSSLVVRASDCQCTSCNGPGFDPSIRRHSGIWGAADEALLNIVRTKRKKSHKKKFKKKVFNLPTKKDNGGDFSSQGHFTFINAVA